MTIMVERRFVHARQRVFLVDDHPLVREWLANVINQQWDLMVCGESEGRENCLAAIGKKKPHVVVMDISLKDCSGLDLIAEIKQRMPEVEIIVLSIHSSPLYAKRALRAGASGYVVKRETTRRKLSRRLSESVMEGLCGHWPSNAWSRPRGARPKSSEPKATKNGVELGMPATP